METDFLTRIFELAPALSTAGTVAILFAIVAVFREASKAVLLPLLGAVMISLVLLLVGELEVFSNVCARQPELRLSEVCAVGKECGSEDDFVELYNPGPATAELACYGFRDRRNAEDRSHGEQPHPLPRRLPEGQLGGGETRAWGRDDLGFGLDKDGDDLELVRLSWSGRRLIGQERIDYVPSIDAAGAYWYRPDPTKPEWVKHPLTDEDAIPSIVTFGEPHVTRSADGGAR